MKTQRAMLVTLSMASMVGLCAPVYAQRHGRADAVQMYARSIPPPELRIQWTARHELDRWRAADLEAMDAHTVVASLSKHSAREVVSGARLGDLLAKRGIVDDVLLEVHYGLFRKKTLRWQELDADHTIVVSQQNGNRLDALWLIAVDGHSHPITIKGVNTVVVKPSSP